MGQRRVPEATVARLPLYLRVLVELAEHGTETVSSEGLAQAAGVTSAQVRKDLSFLGSYGTRGVGYDVEELLHHVSGVLGLNRDWPAMLVGVGNLGRALASYRGFAERGFRLVALVDADPSVVGSEVAGRVVEPLEEVEAIVAREQVAIAVLTVPADAAQQVTDQLVAAGITAVLNFAPAHLEVPPHVRLRKVDLATELQILAYYEARRAAPAGLAVDPAAPGLSGP
jgi:redox-sensing transcriptional repressor